MNCYEFTILPSAVPWRAKHSSWQVQPIRKGQCAFENIQHKMSSPIADKNRKRKMQPLKTISLALFHIVIESHVLKRIAVWRQKYVVSCVCLEIELPEIELFHFTAYDKIMLTGCPSYVSWFSNFSWGRGRKLATTVFSIFLFPFGKHTQSINMIAKLRKQWFFCLRTSEKCCGNLSVSCSFNKTSFIYAIPKLSKWAFANTSCGCCKKLSA